MKGAVECEHWSEMGVKALKSQVTTTLKWFEDVVEMF
jgi:hypothetical protein